MLIVFGHNGQVSRELRIAAERRAVPFLSYSSQQADFRNPESISEIMNSAPTGSVVINAAAYTQVDQAESDSDAATQINATTPGLIAKLCAAKNCKLIHISTDYVFSGEKLGEYLEDDTVGPLGVYGATKLSGEGEIFKNLKQAIILRTSWVFSSHGKNFVKTMVRLGAERDHLSVVSDQIGGPTSAESIARTCLDLATQIHDLPQSSPLWGIYHYSGSRSTSWHGFAQTIFAMTGQKLNVRAISTSEYPTPARRPPNSVLNCEKIAKHFGIRQPDWQHDLSRVLEQLGFDARVPARQTAHNNSQRSGEVLA